MLPSQTFPQTFKPASQLNQTQDGWLVDLSNTQVPHKVKLLLQLGGNFGLPLTSANHNKMAINFIKHIEKNLEKTPESICEPEIFPFLSSTEFSIIVWNSRPTTNSYRLCSVPLNPLPDNTLKFFSPRLTKATPLSFSTKLITSIK